MAVLLRCRIAKSPMGETTTDQQDFQLVLFVAHNSDIMGAFSDCIIVMTSMFSERSIYDIAWCNLNFGWALNG